MSQMLNALEKPLLALCAKSHEVMRKKSINGTNRWEHGKPLVIRFSVLGGGPLYK